MKLPNWRLLIVPSAICAIIGAFANASPLSSFNSPIDTIQAGLNSVISEVNGQTQSQYLTSCSTNTTSNACEADGLRDAVTVNSLTTATNGAVSTAIVVTDTKAAATSQVFCQPNGYAGNGVPADVNIVPGAGNFTFQVQNTSVAGTSLSGNTVSDCLVFN